VPFHERRANPGLRDFPVNYPVYADREHFIARVVGFDAGGFEAVIRCVDAQHMVEQSLRPRGARKPVEERSEVDQVRSAHRARTNLRQLVKQIGADHMLTLTTRQERNSPEELARMFKRFVRLYRSATSEDFAYVAVPERHPSNPNHWHLHVALLGRFKLKVGRAIWWNCCGGRGLGNVDIQYIKVPAGRDGIPKGPLVRAEKIAKYLSKYMSKDLLFAYRPDKKRYWRSEFNAPAARRYWLQARPGGEGLQAALQEFCDRFRVDFFKCSFFLFPSGSGLWMSYNPDATDTRLPSTEPPF
jgi:hypothetical protein